MNTQQKRVILSVITIVVVMLLPILASAQFDPLPSAPAEAPIDGGLSLLIAGGVGYAAKKIKDRKQAKN